jgi:hypothetical protein
MFSWRHGWQTPSHTASWTTTFYKAEPLHVNLGRRSRSLLLARAYLVDRPAPPAFNQDGVHMHLQTPRPNASFAPTTLPNIYKQETRNECHGAHANLEQLIPQKMPIRTISSLRQIALVIGGDSGFSLHVNRLLTDCRGRTTLCHGLHSLGFLRVLILLSLFFITRLLLSLANWSRSPTSNCSFAKYNTPSDDIWAFGSRGSGTQHEDWYRQFTHVDSISGPTAKGSSIARE